MPAYRYKSKHKVNIKRWAGNRFVQTKTQKLNKSHLVHSSSSSAGATADCNTLGNMDMLGLPVSANQEVADIHQIQDPSQQSSYMANKIKHEDLWHTLSEPMLKATYSLEQPPSNCLLCGVQEVPEMFRCNDCGPQFIVCSKCVEVEHRSRPFHSLEKWENGTWLRSDHPSLPVLVREGHECNTKVIEKLIVFNQEGRAVDVFGTFCQCEPRPVTVTRWRLWPVQARNPTICCTFELLEWQRYMLLECHVSQQGFIEAVAWKNALTHEKKCKLKGILSSESLYEYRHMQYSRETLVPDFDDGTRCPACPKRYIYKQNYKNRTANKEKEEKVPSLRSKKKSGFDVFKENFLRSSENGYTQAERMVNAGKAWAEIKADQQRYSMYQAMAEHQNASQDQHLEQLNRPQKAAFIRKVAKEINKLVGMLGRVQQNVVVIISDEETLECLTLGTSKGEDWLNMRSEVETQFAAYCAGNPDPKTQDPLSDLRRRVTDLFNRKYSCGIGSTKLRSLPYSKVDLDPEKYYMSGLPAGVDLKRPSSYGREKLEKILEAADNITFHVLEERNLSRPRATSTATRPPQAGADQVPSDSEPRTTANPVGPVPQESSDELAGTNMSAVTENPHPTTTTLSLEQAENRSLTAGDILSRLANGGITQEEYDAPKQKKNQNKCKGKRKVKVEGRGSSMTKRRKIKEERAPTMQSLRVRIERQPEDY